LHLVHQPSTSIPTFSVGIFLPIGLLAHGAHGLSLSSWESSISYQ